MDANEAFEQEAELFYRATGFLAPGKSESPAAVGQTDFDRYEVRSLMKKAWDAGRRAQPEPAEIEKAIAAKDGAYAERNKLVAALSKLFPASLERHDHKDLAWEEDWRWIVFIDLPTGQVSWHIHDSEVPQFAHLPRKAGRSWDGHTTEEKYARLSSLQKRKGETKRCACGCGAMIGGCGDGIGM